MRVTNSIRETRSALADLCAAAAARTGSPTRLGLVPTMGALHAGHLSLVAAARARCSCVAASIFVNPLQFGPNEDLAKYPRTFEADRLALENAGVDLLFAPSPDEITPSGATTFVEVPGLSDRLDGASRPGHFRGVSTIVSKLFHIFEPDLAFFGQKDAAQVAVLRAMARDLDFSVRLIVCPTVRDHDGLALSSRNQYLSPAERADALALPRALRSTADLADQGQDDPNALAHHLHAQLHAAAGLQLDYAAVVDPDTLLPVTSLEHGALLAVAAWVGTTRLIDNHLLAPVTARVAHAPQEAVHA